ncbi:MAG: hypothetical protein HY905_17695 [Deltaproteobacteria bacterium]|nr:hypothetical protein [Deltaproteobacteria bacterium]
MHRGSTRRFPDGWRRPAALLLVMMAIVLACSSSSRDRSRDPAYMCPRLLDRCQECRKRMPGFQEWDCSGSDGAILERCKGKAAAREGWIDKLAGALDQESCRDFEDAL